MSRPTPILPDATLHADYPALFAPRRWGNIDLTGTPFYVAADEFSVYGYGACGTMEYSSGDQVVDLTGGGYCGWVGTSEDATFNESGGFDLQLVYSTP